MLQLENIHGDIAVTLNLDGSGTATVSHYDEYGNLQDGSTALTFGWLGSYQTATDTASGATVMGARLYSASSGRFLQVDPVYSGSANNYDYCNGDGTNCTDLDGTCPSGLRHIIAKVACSATKKLATSIITVLGDSLCLAYAAALLWLCTAVVGGASDVCHQLLVGRRLQVEQAASGIRRRCGTRCLCRLHRQEDQDKEIHDVPCPQTHQGTVMATLVKQLRISLLAALALMALDLIQSVLRGIWTGNVMSSLGDWALSLVVLCLLVAVVHTAIYGATYIGKPETSESRGVRVGLLALLAVDLLPAWPLWSASVSGAGTLVGTVFTVLALLPLLTVLATWIWSRSQGTTRETARNRALLFGIFSLPVQLLAAAALLAAV